MRTSERDFLFTVLLTIATVAFGILTSLINPRQKDAFAVNNGYYAATEIRGSINVQESLK